MIETTGKRLPLSVGNRCPVHPDIRSFPRVSMHDEVADSRKKFGKDFIKAKAKLTYQPLDLQVVPKKTANATELFRHRERQRH